MPAEVTRLYPAPPATLALHGLYLRHAQRAAAARRPFIYSNFVSSLDGRIAQADTATGRRSIPAAIRHPHDWRLYLELAAQADAVLVSGRRWRELCAAGRPVLECAAGLARGDLAAWRHARGLAPQPACIVLTESLDLPVPPPDRRPPATIVITGQRAAPERARRLRAEGFDVVVADAERVAGGDIRRAADARGFTAVYAVGGPAVLHTLVAAGCLDRLYLTFAPLLLSGFDYDSLLRGETLSPPYRLRLHELYLDAAPDATSALLFAVFDRP